MKPATKEWINLAEDDLLAARILLTNERLTNILAFHCQQALEKIFKAAIEEKGEIVIKSHDLLKLRSISGISVSERKMEIIRVLNEVYIDTRYPGDMGLLPEGKPSISESEEFIDICTSILNKVKNSLIS